MLKAPAVECGRPGGPPGGVVGGVGLPRRSHRGASSGNRDRREVLAHGRGRSRLRPEALRGLRGTESTPPGGSQGSPMAESTPPLGQSKGRPREGPLGSETLRRGSGRILFAAGASRMAFGGVTGRPGGSTVGASGWRKP